MTANQKTAERMCEAVRLMQAGQHRALAALAREVPTQAPGHAEALHLLGIPAVMARRFDEGLDFVNRAIAVSRRRSDFWNTNGFATLKDFNRALRMHIESHPSVRCGTSQIRLNAWSVLMHSGGHRLPHVHPSG